MSSKNTCPCGNETDNNYMCDHCIDESVPAYMVDEKGNLMTIEEVFENSVIVED